MSQSDIETYLSQFKLIPAPETERYGVDACYFVTAPASFNCPAGSYCMSPNLIQPCSGGFYCPANTAQPLYCCAGFYCPTPAQIIRCPEGYYCPTGSTEKFPCNSLASCPEGSTSASRFGVGFIFVGIIVFVGIIFGLKYKGDRVAQEHFYHLLTQSDDVKNDGSSLLATKLAEKPFRIQFKDICLTLPNGVEVVKNVTGEFKSGRMCAIIGPSGSGKTTLINLITDRLKRTSGEVLINDQDESLTKYKKLIGHVPQDDVMIRELHVYDILEHSAKTRLPTSYSNEAKEKLIADTISFLSLSDVASQIIGTEEHRGISGGQRKRVNIAMELVAQPSILFLDEPTSGLDSSIAYDIVTLLGSLAHEKGLLVVAIVHAPSAKAFEHFDDLLVLGQGGGVVYFGPRADAAVYFEQIGFPVPAGGNAADHYVAVASSKVSSKLTSDFIPMDLFNYWDRYCSGQDPLSHSRAGNFYRMAPLVRIPSTQESRSSWKRFAKMLARRFKAFAIITRAFFIEFKDYIIGIFKELADWISSSFLHRPKRHGRVTPIDIVVLYYCFKRALRQIFRSKYQFLLEQLLHLGCGVFISIAARQMDYYGRQPELICKLTPVALQEKCRQPMDMISFIGVFISLGVYFAGISGGTGTFGYEKVVFWRESAAGQAAIPYYLGKACADIIRTFFAAICFTLALIVFLSYRSTFFEIFIIIWMLYLSAFPIGYCISFVTRREAYGLLATVFALVWGVVLSGVIPNLSDMLKSPFLFLWQVSAPRYAIEAFFLAETRPRPFFELKLSTLPHAYKLGNFGVDIALMFCIAVGWNGIALLAMKLFDRDKQR